MTSNIDKLNVIAPLLAGREIYVVSEDQDSIIELFGLFHSLEIDDVYPDSEPIAYFRATEVKEKRSTLARQPGKTWKEMWENLGAAELPLQISQLESIERGHNDRVITIQFFPRGTLEETTLMFTRRH